MKVEVESCEERDPLVEILKELEVESCAERDPLVKILKELEVESCAERDPLGRKGFESFQKESNP